MNKDRLDDLVDILGEKYSELENTFVIKNNIELAKYITEPSVWYFKQLSNLENYKATLKLFTEEKIKDLNNLIDKIELLSYREVDKDAVQVTPEEIIAKNVPPRIMRNINKFHRGNVAALGLLAKISYNQYRNQIHNIHNLTKGFVNKDNVKIVQDKFFEIFKRQTEIGVDKGLSVTYKDGRQITWKSYMEMNSRTTIQHTMSEEQLKYGAKVNQIFMMCDSFSDCADDHAAFQGRLYYNAKANIPDNVRKFINQRHILSVQEVRDNKPWLTTRPNCRHTFHAIPLEEAMGMSTQEILTKEKLERGQYKGSNYQKSQEQRYNERMIRKYKMRRDNGEALYQATGNPKFRVLGNEDAKIKEWQKRNRELIAKNKSLLKRDYTRESIRLITQDLGVRYEKADPNVNKAS